MSYQQAMRKNVFVAFSLQLIKIGITFINRTIFIIYLGIFYQGINSVFANLISFFELFELGIGVSLTYFLYKPLAENNDGKVRGILQLYQKIYRIIVSLIVLAGIGISFFLPIFLKDVTMTPELYVIFGLYVLKMACTYLYAGDTNLMYARQKKYVIDIVDFCLMVVMSIAQMLILMFTQSFLLYMVAWVGYILARSVIVAYISRKQTRYYTATPIPFTANEQQELKQKVLGTFINKVAQLIIYNTDNLLLGMFLSVTYVGIYSNYNLVLMGVTYIANAVVNAMVAVVAHYLETHATEAQYALFKQHNFLFYSAIYFGTLMLFLLLNPFVTVWVGVTFDQTVVAVIVVNFALNLNRKIIETYKTAYGLLEYDKVKDLVEVGLNLALSLLFLVQFNLGLVGILFGTIISNLVTSTWYNPYILYRHGFQVAYRDYLLLWLKQVVVYSVGFAICYYLGESHIQSFAHYTGKVLLAAGAIAAIYLLAYYHEVMMLISKKERKV